MIFKVKKTVETETEVNIETPAYFTDNGYCKTLYKVSESGKIIGITLYPDGHINLLEYSVSIDFDKLKPSTEAEFNAAKEKLIARLRGEYCDICQVTEYERETICPVCSHFYTSKFKGGNQ